MNETAGKILIEGNAAAAIGCMLAGVTVVAWYPITPSSSLCESLISYMKKYRIDKETGKATFAIVQAEDEIASLGMVIGASWAGARSMTATAGPGISLMGEFAGLAYYAEAPAVIDDVLKKIGEWGRYKDVDGDGIAYRTIPGDGMPAYFARGSGHNAKGQYSERPDDYVENMDRLARKFETARQHVPKPVIQNNPKAKIGFIGYGTSHYATEESRDQLREETKVETSYFRLRAYPFTEELAAFVDAHERIYVIEQNRDAQLLQLMKLELTPEQQMKLRSVLHYNGLPIDARSITDDVLAQEGFEVAKKTVWRMSAGTAGGE